MLQRGFDDLLMQFACGQEKIIETSIQLNKFN